MSKMPLKPPNTRFSSGRHALEPAMRVATGDNIPLYSKIRWTFGRGSVIRTIWKSVLLHTLFAIVVVVLTMTTSLELAIPKVMLTVIGVVLGFTISYRAASAYERYWLGRSAWGDLMKTSHTISRLIWYHVPPCRTPRTSEERATGEWKRPEQELLDVMEEKKLSLDLVEGFSVAVKLHLRGEPGLYYDDLYDLVRPLWTQRSSNPDYPGRLFTSVENLSAFSALNGKNQQMLEDDVNPVLNSLTKVTGLEPSFEGSVLENESELYLNVDYSVDDAGADHQGPWKTVSRAFVGSRSNHRLKVASEGNNLPLEVLHCLSEWCSVLEDRGTVPGSSLGSIMACISAFENHLTVMEKILTTPITFLYSAHIRHTVWLFLIFLPFQLVGMFGWHSITGVLIASFIYLGCLAAGEEIEQPFGYDENDLDLDLFCRSIIHADIQQLQHATCLNAYVSRDQKAKMNHRSMTVVEATCLA
ncbi:Bestrophin, RFP-TM, chloride channel-domain-containing protein [Lentinula raphanica]|nr:Bestrophin, RFP-TM, chloride channel-domain-containing protein [Lentinula raphanica]